MNKKYSHKKKITIPRASIISLSFHIIILLIGNSLEKHKTLGNAYIPIEIISKKVLINSGDSINKEISPKSASKSKENIAQDKSINKIKSDKKVISNEKFLSYKKEAEKNRSSDLILRKDLNRGNAKELQQDRPERGSIKGKKTIKITCLKCLKPKYPSSALRQGIEGTPKIKVWIMPNGNVRKTYLLKSSGNKPIDNVSLKAAKESTFESIEEETTIIIEYELLLK